MTSTCDICKTNFKTSTGATSKRHLASKKHQLALSKIEKPTPQTNTDKPELINYFSKSNPSNNIIESKMETKTDFKDNKQPDNTSICKGVENIKQKIIKYKKVSNPLDHKEELLDLSNRLPEGQFYFQEPMFKYMTEYKHSIPAKITDKIFTSFISQDELADAISDSPNPMYYELLQADKPQRMFCELDGKLPFNGLSLEKVLQKFTDLMAHVFETLNITNNNIKLTSASNNVKLSIHWVNTSYVFRNCEIQQKFWNYVATIQAELYPELNCVIRQKNGEKYQIKSIIDTSVYTKNRAMRTIYSTKEEQQRPLLPIKFDGKIREVKRGRFNIMDYFIFQPDATEFCEIKLPIFDKLKSPHITRDMIESEILKMVPNVRIKDFSPPLIKLENVGDRQCIINGEINESDNCWVEWRRDGLWFGCHDDGCEELKKISDLGNNRHKAEIQIDMKYPRFTTDDISKKYSNQILDDNDLHELYDTLIERINTYYSYIKASKSYVMEKYVDDNKELVIVPKQLSTLKDDWSNKGFIVKITKEIKGKPCVVEEYIDIYNYWRKSRKRIEYNKVDLDPKKFLNNTNSTIFNLFDGFAYPDIKQPSNIGHEHPFLKHIREVWCSDNLDAYNFVLNWMAHALQKPWQKMNTCIVLRGSPGCGKGIIVQTFAKLIGKKYMIQPTSSNDVLGTFNSLLMGKLLVFLDEMTWGGDHERAGTVKKLITEKSIVINQKNIAKITVNNFANVIMAGNGQYLHHSDAGARRFLDLEVNERFKRNPNKRQIINDILNCDLRQLANFFYSRDITGFTSETPPITEFQRLQQIQSLSVYDKWWLNELNNEQCVNFGAMNLKRTIYDNFVNTHGNRHTSPVLFWKWIRTRIGAFKNIKKGKKSDRYYVVNMITLEEARDIWREAFNDPNWSFDIVEEEKCKNEDDDIACM
jgi:hypothetical protein